MFSSKYLKKKFLYYYVDINLSPETGFYPLKPLRVFVQLKSSNPSSYSGFLKSFLILKFLANLKTKNIKTKNYLKKRQIKDCFSLLLISKTLLIRKIWVSSFGFCTEFYLKNLSAVPVLEKVFSKSIDLLDNAITLRFFSNFRRWIFMVIEAIDKKL